MATIYRKTDKGQTEIATREHRLGPRLRSALILVDGRKTDEELHGIVPADPQATLESLLEQGFIEAVAAPSTPRPGSSRPAGAASPAPLRVPVSLAPSAVAIIKRDAVRMLTDQVGPMAEALALKIERAANASELRPLLELGQQVLRNTRGAAIAAAFGQRFLEQPGA
jgi:hypothetical protein